MTPEQAFSASIHRMHRPYYCYESLSLENSLKAGPGEHVMHKLAVVSDRGFVTVID